MKEIEEVLMFYIFVIDWVFCRIKFLFFFWFYKDVLFGLVSLYKNREINLNFIYIFNYVKGKNVLLMVY